MRSALLFAGTAYNLFYLAHSMNLYNLMRLVYSHSDLRSVVINCPRPTLAIIHPSSSYIAKNLTQLLQNNNVTFKHDAPVIHVTIDPQHKAPAAPRSQGRYFISEIVNGEFRLISRRSVSRLALSQLMRWLKNNSNTFYAVSHSVDYKLWKSYRPLSDPSKRRLVNLVHVLDTLTTHEYDDIAQYATKLLDSDQLSQQSILEYIDNKLADMSNLLQNVKYRIIAMKEEAAQHSWVSGNSSGVNAMMKRKYGEFYTTRGRSALQIMQKRLRALNLIYKLVKDGTIYQPTNPNTNMEEPAEYVTNKMEQQEIIERSKAKCEALQSENNSECPNTIPFPAPFPTNPSEEFVLWRLRKISHAELRELEMPTSDALYQIEVRPESAYVKEYRKVPYTVNVDIKAFAEHVLYATYRDCIKDNYSPTQTYVEQFQILCKAAQRALDKLKLLPGPDIVQNTAIRELVNLIGLEQLQEQLSGPVVPPAGNPLSYIHHVATCAKIQPIAVSAGEAVASVSLADMQLPLD